MSGDLLVCPRSFGSSLMTRYPFAGSRDEPDNNTHNDYPQIGNLKPRFGMEDRFHREEERLKTFGNWPLEFLDATKLAMSGMFYTGDSDKTKCYFCEVEIGRWEPEDEPVPEHLRWSPNCPLLRRRTTNNVPINEERLLRLLPAPSYDICGSHDIEVRPNAFPESTMSPLRMASDMPPALPTVGSSSSSSGSPTGLFYPEVPEYAIETARLRSFAEWPKHMKQKPEQLAEAGFFYIGVGDRVKCFSCGGGLKDWDEEDDPWEQHALWMSKCRFLKLIKGESFIESVANKFRVSQSASEPSPPASPNSVSSSTAESGDESPSAPTEESSSGEKAAACPKPELAPAESRGALAAQAVCCEQAAPTAQALGEHQKKAPSTIPEEKLCKICYNNEYNTAFLPCGHVVACAKCASSVTKCPMCRKPFADVMRVYFS